MQQRAKEENIIHAHTHNIYLFFLSLQLTFPLSWVWMYVRMSRGILISVIMKEPLAKVPRW